jgi:hypothetical protein
VGRSEGGKVGRWEGRKVGSRTRRRPIRQDYAAAKDAEGGIWKSEVGMRKSEKIEGEKVGRWEKEGRKAQGSR